MTPMILKVSLPFSPTTVCSRTTPLAMLLAAKSELRGFVRDACAAVPDFDCDVDRPVRTS